MNNMRCLIPAAHATPTHCCFHLRGRGGLGSDIRSAFGEDWPQGALHLNGRLWPFWMNPVTWLYRTNKQHLGSYNCSLPLQCACSVNFSRRSEACTIFNNSHNVETWQYRHSCKLLIPRSKHTNGQLKVCLLLNNSFFSAGWKKAQWILGNLHFFPANICTAKQQYKMWKPTHI